MGVCSFVERFERLLERVHREERDVIVSSPDLHPTSCNLLTWEAANLAGAHMALPLHSI